MFLSKAWHSGMSQLAGQLAFTGTAAATVAVCCIAVGADADFASVELLQQWGCSLDPRSAKGSICGWTGSGVVA